MSSLRCIVRVQWRVWVSCRRCACVTARLCDGCECVQDGWPDIVYVDSMSVGWYRNSGSPDGWFSNVPTIIYTAPSSLAVSGLGALWIRPILASSALAVGTARGVMVLTSTVSSSGSGAVRRVWSSAGIVVSNPAANVLCLDAADVNNDGNEVIGKVLLSCHIDKTRRPLCYTRSYVGTVSVSRSTASHALDPFACCAGPRTLGA